jgi:hypothetical protein
VQVALKLQEPSRLEVPMEALVMRKGQTFVPVVDAESRVHYQAVALASTDGERASLSGGVKAGDRIALNLGNSVNDGDKVRIAAEPAPVAK